MQTKRILTIQDISCVGQCSLTVALPVISACGVEVGVLPSALLSNHTAGYSGWTFRDLTDDIPEISARWKKENVKFDAFYTGYLGSTKQIDYVRDIINTDGNPGALKIIDPAMADNGKLYPGFETEFVDSMKTLVAEADFILPNITEAALLTGTEYKEVYDEAYVVDVCKKLSALGAKVIVLTGIGYDSESSGVVIYEQGKLNYYRHKKIQGGRNGTGDIYASVFVGALMRGISTYDAARLAADFVVKAIENTLGDEDHWYGVKFEPAIPWLATTIEKLAPPN
jgi:pyridoxine kinase